MQTKPAKWALVFVQLRWYFLAFFCVMTLTGAMLATRLTFNFSTDNIYLAGDPAYNFYKTRFLPEFGQSANVCIAAIDGDLSKPHVQKALLDLHNEVQRIPEIESVHSLVNTSIGWQKDGVLQQQSVFNEKGEADLEVLKWVVGDPAMQNLLISKEGNIPTISMRLPLKLADEKSIDAIVFKLKNAIAIVAAKYPDLKFYLAGSPIIQYESIGTLKRDQVKFLPLTFLLMGLLLWFSFHSMRGVFLPFIATGAAAVWTLGWLILVGHSLDIINNKLVVLLLVVGISSAVQMFARFQDELKRARHEAEKTGSHVNHDYVVARCVQTLALPCLLTTTIAALGFGSVAISDVTIIRHFGIDAAVGLMGSYVSTMFFVPGVLRLLPLPKEKKEKPSANGSRLSIDRILAAIARFSMGNPKKIVVTALLVVAVGAFVSRDMRADQHLASELPSDADSLVALRFIEEHLTGVMPFEIVIEGTPQRILDPEIIRLGAQFEEFMGRDQLRPNTRSFADLLRSIDRSINPTGVPEPASSFSDAKIAQLSLLLDSGDTALVNEAKRDFYSKDGHFYRIQGLIRDANTTTLSEFRDRVAQKIDQIKSSDPKLADVTIHLTGAALISTNALEQIISSTLASLGVAIFLIFFLVLILLRSWRFAFIALLPNLVPIVVTLCAMQVLGISLRVATVLIFSMALGIAVDACVYLIMRFREEAILHRVDPDETHMSALSAIIERSMRGSGRPVVYTTAMLLAGFSALSISKFGALRDFAILSSVTLTTAMIVDLLLWPALVILIKPKLHFIKKKSADCPT
jgi:predicted RND superfamily exporter protein